MCSLNRYAIGGPHDKNLSARSHVSNSIASAVTLVVLPRAASFGTKVLLSVTKVFSMSPFFVCRAKTYLPAPSVGRWPASLSALWLSTASHVPRPSRNTLMLDITLPLFGAMASFSPGGSRCVALRWRRTNVSRCSDVVQQTCRLSREGKWSSVLTAAARGGKSGGAAPSRSYRIPHVRKRSSGGPTPTRTTTARDATIQHPAAKRQPAQIAAVLCARIAGWRRHTSQSPNAARSAVPRCCRRQ
jgi:hypothetical protein